MKKTIITISLFACIATLAVSFFSCEKEDTTKPVIELLGDNPMYIELNGTYTEPGYTATDDRDGDITSAVFTKNNIETDTIGIYTVTYKVTDGAGNVDNKTRTIHVGNTIIAREGTYSVVDVIKGTFVDTILNDTTLYYDVTITSSTITNNKVTVANFGKYNSSCTVEMLFNATGDTITISNQTMLNAGTGNEGTVAGNGYVDTDGTTLKLNYIVTYTAGGKDTSYATYTKN